MLRSSIASSTQLLSVPARQRLSAQSLRAARARRGFAVKRHNAELRGYKSALKNYNASHSAPFTASAISLKPEDPKVRSPASPSSDTPVHPESVPKAPPSHPTQTSPGSSINPPPHPATSDASSAPPPSPPPRKSGRLRRLLVYFILTTGLAYAGGVWYSLKSDNFHDFFTEYVPFGEDAVLYLEERDFRRRFPNATRHVNRRDVGPREEGKRVTIPGRSGLSWKVAEGEEEEKGSDATKRGKHMSALEANTAAETPAKPSAQKEKTAAVDKAKEDKKSKSEATKKEAPQPAKPEPKKEEPPREPAIKSVATIELMSIEGNENPIVQNMVKTFNDMITVISADEEHISNYEIPVAKAKEEVLRIAKWIASAQEDFEAQAKKEIADAHQMFDKSAAELIRRIDEARAEEAAQYREEFESEREKLAQSYREKIKTELERAQEVAEQRLRNELVEQAIELNRKFVNDVSSLVENEREGRLSKLQELTSNVAELESLTADWKNVIDANLRTQRLQIVIDAVRSVLENSDMPTPFIRELAAVKELSAKDPVISAAISSISPKSYQRGIPSTAQLIDRFRRVAAEVRKASLLPEDAGITSHAASLVMSKVMFQKQGAGSSEGDDVESILSRTENLLQEGNFDEAAREMNGLQGWAKMLSKDWLGDVRRVLEVKQALDIIETEARLQCLQVE